MKIAVIIPAYKVVHHVEQVILQIDDSVHTIYVVDDCCPKKSGDFVKKKIKDNRVKVLYNEKNKGVGGAVITGYQAAIKDGMDVLVKVDGDGQMNPLLINHFVQPIIQGEADYTKGNRFYDLKYIKRMPLLRILGNLSLSFLTKLSSGYWNIFDPTNGFTAIHRKVAEKIDFEKISNRYFFESDMLFRLNILRAKVVDIPMDAVYGDEKSNLKINKVLLEFGLKHLKNFSKRIVYNYFLRDFSVATLELLIGVLLIMFGLSFGLYHWFANPLHIPTPTGTVMIAILPIIVGIQLVLGFISYDVEHVPNQTQSKLM